MKNSPINVALLGVGGYGQTHLQSLRNFEIEGLVRLVAVADPSLDGSATDASEFLANGVRTYTDYRELFSRENDLHLSVIVAPIPLHMDMVSAALKTGSRIYLEKPPVPTIQQWRKLVELDVDQRVAVGFQMIANRHIRMLREWIENGSLGDVQTISFGGLWPRGTGYFHRAAWAGKVLLGDEPVFDGPATNAMSHVLNNVLFFAAASTNAVTAVPEMVTGEFYRARHDIESYDLASIAGSFANGIRFVGTLGHCCATPVPFEIRVSGSRGSAWLSEDGGRLSSDTGLPELHDPKAGAAAVATHYRQTIEWAAGRLPAPVVSLRDTEGFMRTVNTALVSSGAIHEIPSEASQFQCANSVQAVSGIEDVVRECIRNGTPLSTSGLTWTRPGIPTRAREVESVDLTRFVLGRS
jgi:predicted dehydrogenase